MPKTIPVRPYSRDEMIAIADQLEAEACAGKNVRLLPQTAYLAQRAIRMLAAAQTHDDFQRVLCRKFREGQCSDMAATGCLTCHGRANAVMSLVQGG
jgi:hypothetical protein